MDRFKTDIQHAIDSVAIMRDIQARLPDPVLVTPLRLTRMTIKLTFVEALAKLLRDRFNSWTVQDYVTKNIPNLVMEANDIFYVSNRDSPGESSCDSIELDKIGRVSKHHTIKVYPEGFVINGNGMDALFEIVDHFCQICALCIGQKPMLQGIEAHMNGHFKFMHPLSLEILHRLLVDNTQYLCRLNQDCVIIRLMPPKGSIIVFGDGHVLINGFTDGEELLAAYEYITQFVGKNINELTEPPSAMMSVSPPIHGAMRRRKITGPARHDYGKYVVLGQSPYDH